MWIGVGSSAETARSLRNPVISCDHYSGIKPLSNKSDINFYLTLKIVGRQGTVELQKRHTMTMCPLVTESISEFGRSVHFKPRILQRSYLLFNDFF